jgi:aspartyl protease family protein
MDNPKLIFLSLILIVLLSSYLIAMRNNLTKLFKSASVWVIIFSCFIAGYGVWQDLSKEQPVFYTNNGNDIIINMRQDGHFHATVFVNNVEIEFLIDTGATHIVLSKEDAKKLDYDLSKLIFWGKSNTANGIVETAPVRLQSIKLGQFLDTNVLAYINQGMMKQSLLGMSFLNNFSSVEFRKETLTLRL